jgi:hypothetical protein
MKKAVVMALLGLAVLAALPSQARAAGPINFYIRFGVITDQNATFNPFLWTAGVNFDFNISDFLFLSADTDMIVYKFNFNPLWLTPSVMLNLRVSDFYLGGGISKFFILGSGYSLQSDWLFKANAGFKGNSYKLQFFAYTPFDNFFKHFGIGANIGFGF